jgi:hypothetical protein
MPFVTQKRRNAIDNYTEDMLPMVPGDLCYMFYKEMVQEWKENPRWTTAHNIYKKMRSETKVTYAYCPEGLEDQCAKELAWQVFFLWWVVPYEKEKERLNGPID